MPEPALTLVLDPDPRLHEVCAPIANPKGLDVWALASKMLQLMYESNGVGLAAPQVGHLVRLVVLDCSPTRDQPLVLVNPEITWSAGTIVFPEGCLSFPGKVVEVQRAEQIMVRYYDLFGTQKTARVTGLFAVCVQHEIDHLDGITFEQRAHAQSANRRT